MTQTALNAVLNTIRHVGPGGDLTDRQLLVRFTESGDEAAFAVLVRRHASLVLQTCWQELRHNQDAEDAFQATFLVLARKAGVVEWQESVAGWLHAVACRVSAELRRKSARHQAREKPMDDIPEIPGPAPTPVNDEVVILNQELQRLPERYRSPLLLCCLEGRSRDEAAEQLGWTLGMVKGCLERGRELLRNRLARRGVTLGSALAILLLPATNVRSASPRLVGVTMDMIRGRASGHALKIADGVLKAMTRTKLAFVGTILLCCVVVASGFGLVARHVQAGDQDKPPATAKPSPPLVLSEPKLITTVQHRDVVRAVAFTPDGRQIVTAAFDGWVTVSDATSGELVRRWATLSRNSAVAVSPDGKLVAAGDADGELFVWGAVDGKERVCRLTRQGNVYCLAFSPDGRTLASANHLGTISLWDPKTGANLKHFEGHQNRVWWVSYAPDGKMLVSAGEDGTIRLWDPANGKELLTINAHDGYACSVALAPDGRTLASCGYDGRLRLWDRTTGKMLKDYEIPAAAALLYAPDGKSIFTTDRSSSVHQSDVSTGKVLRSLKEHTNAVHCVALTRDGKRLASASEDGTAHVWQLGGNK